MSRRIATGHSSAPGVGRTQDLGTAATPGYDRSASENGSSAWRVTFGGGAPHMATGVDENPGGELPDAAMDHEHGGEPGRASRRM